MKLFLMVSAELSRNRALPSIKYACYESVYVTLRPSSTKVVIVLGCPTGPKPRRMNSESINGAEKPALNCVSVLAGLALMSCESLLDW